MSYRLTHPRINAIIAAAIANLEARPAPVADAPAPTDSPLRKLERAAAMARAPFSEGHRKGIISIVAEILDVTAEEKGTVLANLADTNTLPNPWKPNDVIIPLTCDNGHTYPIGKPVIYYTSSALASTAACLKLHEEQLHVGNNMDRRPQAWRFATREEIEAFGATMRDIVDGKNAPADDDKLLALMGLLPPKPAPVEAPKA